MDQFELPNTPADQSGPVFAWRQAVSIPTYDVAPPDKNPMFLEKRVYQGSSGRVYPLPFYDRVSETKSDKVWEALHIENEFIRVMVLPQLGGRIHVALDKTNGYDFIYRQDVIKPALVGLAGPWISGGIEFNWPQHHRPATYMPTDSFIEEHADGSRTIWCSDHDPMTRMKGMHGVHLRPGVAAFEVRVRLYNRTPLTQTFLWWANIATRVHERYQSFFPPDVTHVADHARRASSRFPLCADQYYGVTYADRAKNGVPESEAPPGYVPPLGDYAANDLSWYANIPVPTSYMCIGSKGDFFGGYDHAAEAGIVHVANHHISPGKKQWTWGNHDFGYAWDRNLTDADARGEHRPYNELMAGVYTDNQPDFSFLAPGETKTFSQHFFPIQRIGPAKQANANAAVNVTVSGLDVSAGVCVTAKYSDAVVRLFADETLVKEWRYDLSPGVPLVVHLNLAAPIDADAIFLTIHTSEGQELIAYKPSKADECPPDAATEIPEPSQIESLDELYVSGVHLAQYRHATRSSESYWQEALRRDAGDSRCNTALGVWRLNRGEFALAEAHFRRAIGRLTRRNANPSDGEPLYHLGMTLRHVGRDEEAYAAFYKSTWNAAWRTPAYFALAQIDCGRRDWPTALRHLDLALRTETDHLLARHLKVIALRGLGRDADAETLLMETMTLDPLDWAARHLAGEPIVCDTQTRLDIALDFMRAGVWDEARRILIKAARSPDAGTSPLVQYYLGFVHAELGDTEESADAYRAAAAASADFCFPARLDEIGLLKAAIRTNPSDARAYYYLGNLLYDRRRHEDAVSHWEAAARLEPNHATTWRNLGIAYFNVLKDAGRAVTAYAAARAADPSDARLLYEQDQLAKRIGRSARERLATIQGHRELLNQRDDLSIEYCALLNQTGDHEAARDLLRSRHFQPWEGGEGLAFGQHVRTHVSLARAALRAGAPQAAIVLFHEALKSPANLGEAKHLLANQSDVLYWLGTAYQASGDFAQACTFWTLAADKRGDFTGMAVRPYSDMTYFSILALRALGQNTEADALTVGLADYAASLLKTPATIDYFATSLPTMLLFDADIQQTQDIAAKTMMAQAALAAGKVDEARMLLSEVLRLDPGHAMAADLFADVSTEDQSLSRRTL